jgi:hypothetical protein
MVFYNPAAEEDLALLLIGLIIWKKHPLSREHALRYVTELRTICDQLDQKSEHIITSNELMTFGLYSFRYRRNRNTIWHIIYDIDKDSNIYITRIISSHSLTRIKK